MLVENLKQAKIPSKTLAFRISVVIPTWNAARLVGEAVSGLWPVPGASILARPRADDCPRPAGCAETAHRIYIVIPKVGPRLRTFSRRLPRFLRHPGGEPIGARLSADRDIWARPRSSILTRSGARYRLNRRGPCGPSSPSRAGYERRGPAGPRPGAQVQRAGHTVQAADGRVAIARP